MTTVLVAMSAALATLVAVLLVLVLRRPPAPERDGVGVVARDMNERLESMVNELTGALERAQEEGRRGRFLSELTASIDLDDVLKRTLEVTVATPGIDAAMIVLPQSDGGPLIATQGMSAEEASRQPITPPSGGGQTGAVAVNYRYGGRPGASRGDLIHGGLLVPLLAGEEPIGTLAAYWRGVDRELPADEIAHIEELAASSGPAIENARRYQEARQLADLDALTGLHNKRYFNEVLDREVARAHRYNRRLALLILDLDDFKTINDSLGHLAGDGVLADVAGRIRDAVRSADIACRVGGEEFAVIMPESALPDAEQLFRRIQTAISQRLIAGAGRLTFSGGVAELRSSDEARALFERADTALYQAKETGKARLTSGEQ